MGRAFVLGTLGILLAGIALNTGCSSGGSSPPPPGKTLTSISVTPKTPSIATGTTQQFTATGNYSDGSSQVLTTSVTWSSSQPTVATISNSSGTQGLATSVGTGASLITATSGSVNGSTTLTVTAAALVSLEVTPASPSITVGTTQQFTATGHYSDGSTQNFTTSVGWNSSDPTVATISTANGSQGLATGLKAGNITITALLDFVSGTTDLTVTSPVNASVWTQDGPVARFSQSSVFDSGTSQMIVFGGEDAATGADLNDLWLISTGIDKHLRASSMTASGPSARHGHAATYDSNSNTMTIFGGGSGSPLACTNDAWVLDKANGVGGSPTWNELTPSGGPPAKRMLHDAVYDPTSNTLIVFGGSDCGTGYFNDVWLLSNANGQNGSPTWTKVTTSGTPPAARESSSAIYDSTSNVLTIYGGDAGITPFADVWTLSNANGSGGTPTWSQLIPSGTPPAARSGHSALYDSANNRMIVFGGVSGTTTFGDVWILTNPNGAGSSVWSEITATGTAPTLYFHAAAYDETANAMYLFGGTSTTPKLQISNHTFVLSKANGLASGSPTWTVSGPPVRYSQSAFYDSATNDLFVFGGQHATMDINFNDYWRNAGVIGTTGVNWTNVSPTGTKPVARFGHTAVYDSVSKTMMLFGGATGFPAPCMNDYWILQNANAVGGTPAWVFASPAGNTPTGRMNYGAAYDAGTNSLIMFGGYDCTNKIYLNDVWVLHNANDASTAAWTQLAPAGTAPSLREGSSAVYDPGTNSLIVFGGDADFANGAAPFGDIWLLSHANGSGGTPAWTELTPSNNGAAARSGHSAIFDATNNRMTVYGGFDGSNVLSDTWILTGANGHTGTPVWIPLNASPAGPPRRWHSAVYDPTSNEMLIFGGVSAMVPLAPDANTFSLTEANGLP